MLHRPFRIIVIPVNNPVKPTATMILSVGSFKYVGSAAPNRNIIYK